jgi:hypothetical protein
MHRSRLPVLSPCSESWDAMTGDRTRRHCAACEREVIDLSAMHAEAAIDALLEHPGRTCIRYASDADGEILFAPPPPRRAGLAAAMTLAVAACAGWEDEPQTVPPGELGMCTPEAEFAGDCSQPAVDPPPQPPHEHVVGGEAVVMGGYTMGTPAAEGVTLNYTALMDISVRTMGDTSGIEADELRRMQQQLRHEAEHARRKRR